MNGNFCSFFKNSPSIEFLSRAEHEWEFKLNILFTKEVRAPGAVINTRPLTFFLHSQRVIGGVGLDVASNSLYDVDDGHGDVMFNRILGIKENVDKSDEAVDFNMDGGSGGSTVVVVVVVEVCRHCGSAMVMLVPAMAGRWSAGNEMNDRLCDGGKCERRSAGSEGKKN
ncbi:hypothetical protein LguiA_021150 [Lonicera macranthoides]